MRETAGRTRVLLTVCRVCQHPERAEIDARLLAGAVQADIMRDFGLGRNSVSRHLAHHLRGQIVGLRRGFETREIAYAKTLAAKVETLLLETLDILQAARTKTERVSCPLCKQGYTVEICDIHGRVAASRAVGKTLELLGKISGEIQSGDVTKLYINLGVRSEAEIKSALALQKSVASISLDDAFDDSTAALEMVCRERPDLAERLKLWFDRRSFAVEESTNGQEKAQGNGLVVHGFEDRP